MPRLRAMDFAARLRAAVSASSLSLEQISAELGQRGTPVSRSSLSGWQSGVSRPERPASLTALAQLEALLGLRAGELRESLPPRPQRGRSGNNLLRTEDAWNKPDSVARVMARLGAVPNDPGVPQPLSQRLHLVVDEHGHMRSLSISTLLRARVPDTRRIISVSADDSIHDAPQVVTARGATVGRFRADPPSGVSAYELLFHRPLDQGEVAVVDYTEHFPPRVGGTDLTVGMHPGARDVVLSVQFHPTRLPVEVVAFMRTKAGRPEQFLENLTGTTVQLARLDPSPGIYGIRWSWPA